MTPEEKREKYLEYQRWYGKYVRVVTEEQKAVKNEALKRRRRENPEKYREITRKSERKRRLKRYGLTEDEYNQLFDKQGCVCAICSSNDSRSVKGWHLDHCHVTGKVRGVLCHRCNLMLGNSVDNPLILEKGAAYLRKYRINE